MAPAPKDQAAQLVEELTAKNRKYYPPFINTITINSILGGHSPLLNFSRADQFKNSMGVDPSLSINDLAYASSPSTAGASGYLRPSSMNKNNNNAVKNAPLWLKGQPKAASPGVFVYDLGGSVYTAPTGLAGGTTALNDGGSMTGGHGNGCEYYDNYMYFAKDTDIARYGPLNGSPVFDGTYWTGTLGKAALTNTTYPRPGLVPSQYPNHVLHRHSNGKLYIADVVGNQGTLHFIQTTKTTVEGDTDNGSTASALTLGYGLWPTAMEEYGDQLIVALVEIEGTISPQKKAKVAFWDTTSQNFNSIAWVEYPDYFISSIKNIDGVLYFISGSGDLTGIGFRVYRYVGGNSFEEVIANETSSLPMPGAVDGDSKRLLMGSFTNVPESGGVVYSYGLTNASFGQALFSVSRHTAEVHSVMDQVGNALTGHINDYIVGWSLGSGTTLNNIDSYLAASFQSADYSVNPAVWWSQLYRIGQPFKITKIRILLAQAIATNMIVTPKIYLDSASSTKTLVTINNTAYNGKKSIVIRPENLVGDHDFWLELRWTGSALCVVSLPITIEYELIPD